MGKVNLLTAPMRLDSPAASNTAETLTDVDLCKKALFAPSVVGKCSFIGHKLRFAA